jgi:putative DNA primase/helicase
VLFLTAEDDAGDTLRPRLEAAGADVKHIHLIEGVVVGCTGESTPRNRLFSLVADLEALSQKLRTMPNAAVLIMDPISAYLGNTDSHKNSEVRGLLAPLGELAARHNIAVIGISHLTKAACEQALMRVSGSLAFVAAARAAYLVAHDQTNQTRRLFVPFKNNLGPDGTGLAYRIEPATVPSATSAIDTSRVVWEPESVTISADEAMRSPAPDTSALKDAEEWVQEVLGDGQYLPAKEVFALAREHGISRTTLRRAAKNLGIKPKKEGRTGPWSWGLPAEDNQI